MARIRRFTYPILFFLAIASASAQVKTVLVLKSEKYEVTAHKPTVFRFSYRNDGEAPVVFTPAKGDYTGEECKPLPPSYAKPIHPGETRTLLVECKFRMDTEIGAKPRTPAVQMVIHVRGAKPKAEAELIELRMATGVTQKTRLPVLGKITTPEGKVVVSNRPDTEPFDAYKQTGYIKFSYEESGVLLGPDCAGLTSAVAPLVKMKREFDGITLPSPACTCHPQDPTLCKISFLHLLPKVIADYMGKKAETNGPNCMSSALKVAGFLEQLSYASSDELKLYLTTPEMCRELAIDEVPQPGDLIRIQEKTDDYHVFVYLTPSLAFSKNGNSKDDRYLVQPPADVFAHFEVPRNCRRINPAFPSALYQECRKGMHGRLYRCHAPDHKKQDVLARNPELAAISRKIDELECRISTPLFVPNGNVISSDNKAVMHLLDELIPALTYSDLMKPEDLFFRKALLIRLQSLREQTIMTKETLEGKFSG